MNVDRDSVDGTATDNGLEGPRVRILVVARDSAPDETGPAAHPALYTMGTNSLPEVKRSGRVVDNPPSSRTELKKDWSRISIPFWALVTCSTRVGT